MGRRSGSRSRAKIVADDGTVTLERGERQFAPGERVMFLKNDRELGVRNGTLGTVTEVKRDAMRVVLDGAAGSEISFNLRDYTALDYGYAATVHKAQGATVNHSFVLATPGMDRHLGYVGITRHREGAELYASRDDFKGFEDLKERLSRARPKDSTLDYAQRRGMEAARAQEAEKQQSARRQEPTQRSEREAKERGQERKPGRRSRRALQAGAKGVHPGGWRRRLRTQGQGAR